MTTATDNTTKALALAKGSFQRGLIEGTETLGGSTLRGEAKRHQMGYIASGRALCARLTAAGIPWHAELGPRGGLHSARLVIDR